MCVRPGTGGSHRTSSTSSVGSDGALLCHWPDPAWQAGLPARELDPEHLLHLRGVRWLDAGSTARRELRGPEELARWHVRPQQCDNCRKGLGLLVSSGGRATNSNWSNPPQRGAPRHKRSRDGFSSLEVTSSHSFPWRTSFSERTMAPSLFVVSQSPFTLTAARWRCLFHKFHLNCCISPLGNRNETLVLFGLFICRMKIGLKAIVVLKFRENEFQNFIYLSIQSIYSGARPWPRTNAPTALQENLDLISTALLSRHMVIHICRKAGPLIRQANGPPPTRGSLNMEVCTMVMMVNLVMLIMIHFWWIPPLGLIRVEMILHLHNSSSCTGKLPMTKILWHWFWRWWQ